MTAPVTALVQHRHRSLFVRWMYAVALAHLLVGVFLAWASGSALLESYHRSVEAAFWGSDVPAGARSQQVWWMSLFGASIQVLAAWMFALVQVADKRRMATVWLWLAVPMLLWAPQDIFISARAAAWPHVWADGFALLVMLPPLLWLYRHDSLRREDT